MWITQELITAVVSIQWHVQSCTHAVGVKSDVSPHWYTGGFKMRNHWSMFTFYVFGNALIDSIGQTEAGFLNNCTWKSIAQY